MATDFKTVITATRGEQYRVERYWCNTLIARYFTADLAAVPRNAQPWMYTVAAICTRHATCADPACTVPRCRAAQTSPNGLDTAAGGL